MTRSKYKVLNNGLMVGPKKRKAKIHVALREQVWLREFGETFSAKCHVSWCQNRINVFNFQCGHRLAESRGGATALDNLAPICGRCNQSMATMHMDDWQRLGSQPQAQAQEPKSHWRLAMLKIFRCFKPTGH